MNYFRNSYHVCILSNGSCIVFKCPDEKFYQVWKSRQIQFHFIQIDMIQIRKKCI